MMWTIKIKPLLAITLLLLLSFFGVYAIVNQVVTSVKGDSILDYTIVLDAGHGGRDGGSVGSVTGVKESDLNLAITKKLAKNLRSFGFNVVLTRENENGLYDVFSRDYKLEDMGKRKDIILKNNANIVISLHMNSYPVSKCRGVQAFHDPANPNGKLLAETIQQTLVENIEHARKEVSKGDYYILKCTQNPSVMIECGFLSNPEDEALLSTDDYQTKLAYYIFYGIVKYFNVIA